MIDFLQKYDKVLLKGGVITAIIAFVLVEASFVIINPLSVSTPVYIIINILGLAFCWFSFSFLIYKFPLYKVLGVVGLLLIVVVIETYIKIPNNPITFPLLIFFWLGIAYLISPEFFKKYRIAIFSIYGIVLSYFFIFRTMPNYERDHHQNFLSFLLIPIPVFIILWFYEQWRWLKTLQADKGKAELALLKSQINPHFFFNTLNNLYGLIVEKSENAPAVVLKLSDMMRYTIYEGKEDFVLLRDEINYLENYIELHKIRYQKKVKILFNHEVQENLKVAPLLFIILLENAFKHGVEKMRKNAFIQIEMKSQGKKLFFKVENNYDELPVNRHKGIGLDNLKKRLVYSYQNQHELIIEEKEFIYTVHLNLELI